MSVNEKRELVRELSKCQFNVPEQLQEWSRREISEVLCAELGRKAKEKTFSLIPKHKMLDLLFKRKNGSSSLLPVMAMARTPALTAVSSLTNNAHLCQNSACSATMNPGDKFCKRCSCCICFKYDDNKDPTLWFFCNSDHPSQEDSCGFSCHLECAIEDERSGIQQSGQSKKLDGGHRCTQCGKHNDLLGWQKNARRLDVLCHRIFLSHKILISTKKYLVLHDIVDTTMKKLEAEVGPITAIRGMGHGLVGRLAVGAEVQKLCICAIEAVQSLFSDPNTPVQTTLHRESSHLMLNSRETFQQNLNADAARLEDASDVPSEYELAGSQPYNGAPVPITNKGISAMGSELKADHHTAQTSLSKPETEPESSSKKSLSGKPEEVKRQDGQSEASYKYCVKVIRRLECEGYIEASFRVKFLTWFCLQATPHERRRVTVYLDTLMDDPVSLAAKLADTYNERPHRVPSGFCWELRH
uniref:Uncharacterized protein n=1 Tax=Setaria viridis TaxID=4556 RepID=A0A4U6V1N5_SETVI|nr:hypothetical protein SEVIR_4G262600v2 [Setaria viridis]